MLPHNYTDEERERALAIANSGDKRLQDAKADLMGKAGTKKDDSSAFMDAYGFLPAAYFRKIRQNEEGSGGAYQQFRKSFRQPAGRTSEFGQQVIDTVEGSTAQTHVGGVPLEEWMRQNSTAPRPGMDDTDVLQPGGPGLLTQGGQLAGAQ